jgi:TRAP-type uncharacterized transport system substrate-binding protein
MVVPKSLSDQDVVKILDFLHSNWSEMGKDYNNLTNFSPSEFVHETQTIPYHKAAVEYFKSGKGLAIWDDGAEARNQKLIDVWN